MNKEFVPYEQALALKELGFDETCFMSYNPNPNWWDNYCTNSKISSLNGGSNIVCSAPLYQQAFRWFRNKYKMDSLIMRSFSMKYSYHHYIVIDKFHNDELQSTSIPNRAYEEAELECLKKLIEIVKKQYDGPAN